MDDFTRSHTRFATWFKMVGSFTVSNKGGQSNTVNNYGTSRDIHAGNIKITSTSVETELSRVRQAVEAAPNDVKAEATDKLGQLQTETAKGSAAHDNTISELVKGLVGLVPSAASAIVSAFGAPILGALSLPITKAIVEKLRSE